MRRCFAILLLIGLGLFGCASVPSSAPGTPSTWDTVKEQAAEATAALDALAQQNSEIVEKLVLDPGTVTEDEKVLAIRNARLMAILTQTLNTVMGGD